MGILRTNRDKLAKALILGLVVAISGWIIGCSGSDESSDTTPGDSMAEYKDWKQYTYQRVRLMYPPDHPHADKMGNITRGYISAIKRDCALLEIPVPRDTLKVFFYNDVEQGRKMTGREYSFVVGDTIHMWMPTPLGAPLMQWILPFWIAKVPQYQFLQNGLISLVDDSKRDYHAMVQGYVDSAIFIGLSDLAVDTTADVNLERYQSGEAASFIDFMLYTYGMPALHALYLAESPFDMTVQGILKINTDSLQAEWVDYIYRVNRGETPPRKIMPWSTQPADSIGQ